MLPALARQNTYAHGVPRLHVTSGDQPEHRRLVLRRPHARSPGNRHQGQGAHGHAPVSYTHLTLPTICSV
eukprot:6451117-Alexandrium_andersonii.AAC.1